MSSTSLLRFAIVAAALSAPALASAAVRAQTNLNNANGFPSGYATQSNFSQGAIGGGMTWGASPGHVTSPGQTQIDNDSRGPIDGADVVTPATGNNRAAVNPKPVR